jgi:hypothetical protein
LKHRQNDLTSVLRRSVEPARLTRPPGADGERQVLVFQTLNGKLQGDLVK